MTNLLPFIVIVFLGHPRAQFPLSANKAENLTTALANAPSMPQPDADSSVTSATEDPADLKEDSSSEAKSNEYAFPILLTEKTFLYSGGGYEDREFRYRLFVPEGVETPKRLPMLVWLHGLGESGDDNISQLRYLDKLIFTPPRRRSCYPFYFLAVQCPKENPNWTTSSADADDMLNVVIAILDETCEQYPIDPDRVSVAGISSGGTAAWEFAARQPEMFSAVAPISSAGANNALVQRLNGTPVWAFHSQRDPDAPISAVAEAIKLVNEGGGAATLTAVNVSPTSRLWVHDAWTEAFKEYELLEWLLAQRRGETTRSAEWHVLQERYLNWDYLWPRLIPIAVLSLAVVAWKSERRRRLKSMAASDGQ